MWCGTVGLIIKRRKRYGNSGKQVVVQEQYLEAKHRTQAEVYAARKMAEEEWLIKKTKTK